MKNFDNDIPKIIHYCWFGGNPLPKLAVQCIESWKKYCPDYEIIEWNESNFDFRDCPYASQAYEKSKWAFVSDYARFKILYEYGGVYFDTDVELIRPLDDIIERGGFMGCEKEWTKKVSQPTELRVAPGLGLAASPHLPLVKELFEKYYSIDFINKNGTYNTKTVVEYTSEILAEHGLKATSNVQFIDGLYIYPKEYFCPIDYVTNKMCITINTHSIHYYTASWHSPKEREIALLRSKMIKIFPDKWALIISTGIYTFKYEGGLQLLRKILSFLRRT